MSAFGGRLRFDGGVVERSWLETIGGLLARRGPDGESVHMAGVLGMVFRAYGDTPDDHEQSSLWQSDIGALLAFDGRLDNGPDIAYELGLRGSEASLDSRILLRGFERWGADFVGKIVGDFALAYWNPSTKELTLGRDAVGVRTLYYHHSRRHFVFATDLGSLIRGADIDRELDDDYIVGYLAIGVDEEHTVYRNVSAVKPAHVVVVSLTGQSAKHTVWSLSRAPEMFRWCRDEEYEERFRTLFRDAVKCRLRTVHPVVAELSGGLDSSSVVCMADHLLRSGEASAPSFSTSSFVTQQSPTNDESRFRAAVEEHCGREAFHIHESDRGNWVTPDKRRELHVPSYLHVGWAYTNATCLHMRERRAHALLTGHGGDEMFWSVSDPVPGLGDLWAERRFVELRRELHTWSHALRQPYIRLAWRSFEAGVLRRQWRPDINSWEPPPWVHPKHREHARALRDAFVSRVGRYALASCENHAWGYQNNVGVIANGHMQELDGRSITYPCLHRPLVEYLHAVPFEQKLRLGENRSLQRRALRTILPALTLARRGKVPFSEPLTRLLRDGFVDWDDVLKNSVAASYGYIDARGAHAAAAQAYQGIRGIRLPLTAIALEMWLRTHETRMEPSTEAAAPEPATVVSAS